MYICPLKFFLILLWWQTSANSANSANSAVSHGHGSDNSMRIFLRSDIMYHAITHIMDATSSSTSSTARSKQTNGDVGGAGNIASRTNSSETVNNLLRQLAA